MLEELRGRQDSAVPCFLYLPILIDFNQQVTIRIRQELAAAAIADRNLVNFTRCQIDPPPESGDFRSHPPESGEFYQMPVHLRSKSGEFYQMPVHLRSKSGEFYQMPEPPPEPPARNQQMLTANTIKKQKNNYYFMCDFLTTP